MRQSVQTRIANHPAALAATQAGEGTPINETDPKNPTFERDIKPLFEQFRGPMMWRLDLGDYDAVVGNAGTIYNQISTNSMPPPPFPSLTAAQIATFNTWMNNGCPRR